jgi:quinohemoprotein ethanol dehydrogenase
VALDRAAFQSLLRGGALIGRGMPLFDDLSEDEIGDIYQYIRSQARQKDIDQQPGKARSGL